MISSSAVQPTNNNGWKRKFGASMVNKSQYSVVLRVRQSRYSCNDVEDPFVPKITRKVSKFDATAAVPYFREESTGIRSVRPQTERNGLFHGGAGNIKPLA
jgi:hypothetical protein